MILKAGPDGADHGHPDQLAIQLFGAGARLAPDLGTAGYGIDLNDGWYRQTASHSPVLVDEQSQPLARGRLRPLGDGGDHQLACGARGIAGELVIVTALPVLVKLCSYSVWSTHMR